jgi:oligopeptide transport system permease protein
MTQNSGNGLGYYIQYIDRFGEKSMFQFLVRKFMQMLTVLLGVAVIMFFLMHAVPGNPWSNYSDSPRMILPLGGIDRIVIQQLSQHFGLDLPLWRQFTRYVIGDFEQDGSFFCGALCGNLGPSIQKRGRSVQGVLFEPPEGMTFWDSRFGYSIRMVSLAALIAFGLGIPLGIMMSATGSKSRLNRIISISLAALTSIPNFVLGLLAILIAGSWLKIMSILPNWNHLSTWIIPAIVLAVMPMASLARVTRASLTNILNEDYVRTAHGKGLTKNRVMLVHVLRNALVPIITFMGPTLMEMFTGLFIVENMFSFPGLGREYWESILTLDYPMIMGLTLLYATGVMLTNILIEVICERLDPRIRSSKLRGAL